MKKKDKENSASTSLVFARLNNTHRLLTSRLHRRRIENVPESVYRTLFERIYITRVRIFHTNN